MNKSKIVIDLSSKSRNEIYRIAQIFIQVARTTGKVLTVRNSSKLISKLSADTNFSR